MGKDINLNSGEWCDVVFEGKNKQYGAYRLRQSSSKRHIAAFIVMLLFATFVAALPGLIGVVKNLTAKDDLGPMEDTFAMSNIPVEEQVQQENLIKQETAPPPPPLKTTVKFTPPVITEDDKIDEDKLMKSQEDLTTTKITISVADVKGTDDKHGVDIAELKEHKVIVEQKVDTDKPFVTVEQMPTFPGGEMEMHKFINENLKYPVVAQETGVQGRVTIRFVVTKTGAISDVTVIRGIDPSCDKEAVRVVKAMPNWIPGKQNGLNVPVYFTLPIVFKLRQ
ncbi:MULTISPECIES: energy transducer TonB [unclassified Dysgonomonas]|uniref:energy transducer TonB n=1 Tax=unclassified Dysgonomonas TaxID=2630389 RepID=UPI0013ED64A8|nr:MULTISPECIES: energy transducer TonB [unclassified Dysgonomonas]